MSYENTPKQEWIEDPKGVKSESYIDLIFNHYADGQHWLHAGLRFDGCVHFTRAYNSPFPKENDDDQDYIHICDIDEMIKQLTLLKQAALKHFGEDWPR